MVAKVKVGLIGTGAISKAYIKGCRSFDILDLVACSDIDMERARAVAAEHNIPRASTVEELLADPEIQIAINLTIPRVHAEVSLNAIQAGKNVFSEKPLAATQEDGRRVITAAREKGVLIGCAPDTFLSGAQQTCRKLIDDGAIGEPVAAVSFFAARWHDHIPPSHNFLFQAGAGPMMDMGVYYVTALLNLLGPVRRITGSTRQSFSERIVQRDEPGERRIEVTTPTHISGTLDFASGVVGTLIASFDVHWGHNLPLIEIYGSEGLLSVPDPNMDFGTVQLRRPGGDWQEVAHTHAQNPARGVGVADMAYALTYQRPLRASGNLAYHALEIMTAFERASTSGRHIEIASQMEQPAALPAGLPAGQL